MNNTFMLYEITMDEMIEMAKRTRGPVYGIPVHIAFDEEGRSYTYPLSHPWPPKVAA